MHSSRVAPPSSTRAGTSGAPSAARDRSQACSTERSRCDIRRSCESRGRGPASSAWWVRNDACPVRASAIAAIARIAAPAPSAGSARRIAASTSAPIALRERAVGLREARFLVLEELVEGGPRDAGAVCDLADLRGAVPVLGDYRDDRLAADARAGRCRFGGAHAAGRDARPTGAGGCGAAPRQGRSPLALARHLGAEEVDRLRSARERRHAHVREPREQGGERLEVARAPRGAGSSRTRRRRSPACVSLGSLCASGR